MSKQEHDSFVPDRQVLKELNVTKMTLHRWTLDPKLDFPPKIKIRGHNFRSRILLEKFKARMLAAAIKARSE